MFRVPHPCYGTPAHADRFLVFSNFEFLNKWFLDNSALKE